MLDGSAKGIFTLIFFLSSFKQEREKGVDKTEKDQGNVIKIHETQKATSSNMILIKKL